MDAEAAAFVGGENGHWHFDEYESAKRRAVQAIFAFLFRVIN